MHCPGENATGLIWRVLTSSDGITSWTPLKHQHCILCSLSVQWEPTACRSCQCCQKKGIINSLWVDFLSGLLRYSSHTSHHPSLTPFLPWISYATQKLMLVSCKMLQKQSEAFHRFLWYFPSLKQNFIAYPSSKVSPRPDCIFEIHQLWQSGLRRIYSISCSSCSFEREIIKIGQSSHKMYSNNIVNFQVSTTILNACKKMTGNLLKAPRINWPQYFLPKLSARPLPAAEMDSKHTGVSWQNIQNLANLLH